MSTTALDAPAPVGFAERIWRINWGLALVLTAIAGVGVLALYSAAGGRIERQHADTGDRRQHQRQTPVDAPDPFRKAHRRRCVQRSGAHLDAIFRKRSLRRDGSRFMVSISTSRPIGPAVLPPAWPCSTMTAQA